MALVLFFLSSAVTGSPNEKRQSGDPHAVSRKDSKSKQSIELRPKEAAALAKRRHGGKVIGIRREGNHYKVRLMKEGRVREVSIPVILKQ